MPAMKSYLGNNTAPALATGLTGLDQTATAFSWGAWIKNRAGSVATTSYLWTHTDNAANVRNGISIILLTRGRIDCTVADATTASATSPAGIVAGDWAHYGIMYDGANVYTLKNGVVVAVNAMTKAPAVSGTRQTAVGQSAGGLTTFLPEVWDIRVSPAVALSLGEMKAIADPRNPMRGCKQRLFYQRNWRAAGTGAVTVPDESGNGNNLTTSAVTLDCDTTAEPDWYRVLYRPRPALKGASAAPSVLHRAYSNYW